MEIMEGLSCINLARFQIRASVTIPGGSSPVQFLCYNSGCGQNAELGAWQNACKSLARGGGGVGPITVTQI